MGLMTDLDEWFNEHEEDFGVHRGEVARGIKAISNAIDMVGE